jgi:hypothetical protein
MIECEVNATNMKVTKGNNVSSPSFIGEKATA